MSAEAKRDGYLIIDLWISREKDIDGRTESMSFNTSMRIRPESQIIIGDTLDSPAPNSNKKLFLVIEVEPDTSRGK